MCHLSENLWCCNSKTSSVLNKNIVTFLLILTPEKCGDLIIKLLKPLIRNKCIAGTIQEGRLMTNNFLKK